MIEDFQHVGIVCQDLERSVRFYEKLGLQVIEPTVAIFYLPSTTSEIFVQRGSKCERGHEQTTVLGKRCQKMECRPV